MYTIVKRGIDLFLSIAAIVVLSPILIATSILLLVTGEHLVFYRQRRVGRDYRDIDILKFVTMRSDSEKLGTITAKNDPRVLPVGKFLRKTKVNELPQLFSILAGQMSIVGPRPLVRSEVDMYPESLRKQIYDGNTPGLTGIGSLFFRDEDEIVEGTGKAPEEAYREDIMPIKGAVEAWYRRERSFRIDAIILFLTAWAVLFPRSVPIRRVFGQMDSFPQSALQAYQSLIDKLQP